MRADWQQQQRDGPQGGRAETRASEERAPGHGPWLKRLAWVKPSTKLRDTMWACVFSGNSLSNVSNVESVRDTYSLHTRHANN